MRAAPGRPRAPRLPASGGGSPLAALGTASLPLGLLSQLKFSFQLPPASRARTPGRAPSRPGPAALSAPRRGSALPPASF